MASGDAAGAGSARNLAPSDILGATGSPEPVRADLSGLGASGDPDSVVTLASDCGGGGIKTSLLDAKGAPIGPSLRTPVPYPMTPWDLFGVIEEQAGRLGSFDRLTLGLPGMIRSGKVVYTPHYIRTRGPHTTIDPKLAAAWNGLDMTRAAANHFGVPVLVLNDAEVAAAAVVSGTGCELVLTLGTGLGATIVVDGKLAPHLEISHAPAFDGLTFDGAVGEVNRQRLGNEAWGDVVVRAISALWEPIRWDKLFVGGGNTARLPEAAKRRLLADFGGPDRVRFIPNAAGMTGGVRAWDFV